MCSRREQEREDEDEDEDEDWDEDEDEDEGVLHFNHEYHKQGCVCKVKP